MTKQSDAARNRAKSDAALANAMHGLENDIAELRDMAAILASLIREYINPLTGRPPSGCAPSDDWLGEEEIRQLTFAGYDVERRARELFFQHQSAFTTARAASGLPPL